MVGQKMPPPPTPIPSHTHPGGKDLNLRPIFCRSFRIISRNHQDLACWLGSQIIGLIVVEYRSVICSKYGGIKFTISGSASEMGIIICNVGGPGDIDEV
jgi:hypothetical protein